MAEPTKKLGFGFMRFPKLENGEYDVEQLQAMVDEFMARGFTYFDSAYAYGGGKSEPFLGEMLVKRYPRDSYTVATKLHSAFFNSYEDRDKVFDEQRRRTGLEYFDYYLLHGIQDNSVEKYEKFDCFAWLRAKQEADLAKEIGISFHGTPELLDRLLTDYPYLQFVQLQINYLDWDSLLIRARDCYDVARKHGKPIVIMEPVKGGTLAALPEDVAAKLTAARPDMSVASWAIRYAASLPGIRMVLSGMTTLEQTRDNLTYMDDFQPLSDEELALLEDVRREMNARIAIPCTACSYCTDGCPKNIAIPDYFALYNNDMQEIPGKWSPAHERYGVLIKDHGRAGDCIGCGQCEGVCPQHLPIIEHLQAVSKMFD